jgi:hypothetical protein
MLPGNKVLVVQHTALYFHDLILLNRWTGYDRVPNSARPKQESLKRKSQQKTREAKYSKHKN